MKKLLGIFASPVQPELEDYYEPWTYDYETLVDAPLGDDFPVARPKSLITGEDTKITWSANWDDNLGGAARDGPPRPDRGAGPARVRGQDQVRVRADLHVLPAADLRALPQPVVHGVLPLRARSTSAPRTASCWSTRTGAAAGGSASPAARTRRSTSTTRPARPRSAPSATRGSRSGLPTVCSETCVGRLRYLGLFLYDADAVTAAAADAGRAGPLRGAAGPDARPGRPRGGRARPAQQGIPDDWLDAARRSPVYALAKTLPVALPLHPEYRTMPMVWYVPPLSPIVDLLARAGPRRRGPRRTCSVRSTRCASRSSTSPSCSPPATPTIVDRRAAASSPRCAPTCATSPWAATPDDVDPRGGRDDARSRCTRCTG